jgi:hypothetical protein
MSTRLCHALLTGSCRIGFMDSFVNVIWWVDCIFESLI